jgi:hypothetical protein
MRLTSLSSAINESFSFFVESSTAAASAATATEELFPIADADGRGEDVKQGLVRMDSLSDTEAAAIKED